MRCSTPNFRYYRFLFGAAVCALTLAASSAFPTSAAFAVEKLAPALSWKLGDATLVLSNDGRSQLLRGTDAPPVASPTRAFELVSETGSTIPPIAVKPVDASSGAAPDSPSFDVDFADGSRARFASTLGDGFALFELVDFDSKTPFAKLRLFKLAIPSVARSGDQINRTILPDDFQFGLTTASLVVRPTRSGSASFRADEDGCSHSFLRRESPNAAGGAFAEFVAESTRDDGAGWAVCGKDFDKPLDLTGCRAIRARVWGDAKTEALKIQLGGKEGHRDDYISIDFDGWKTLDLVEPALNDLTYDDVRRLYFYYNGLPANESVRCLIDRVEAVFGEGANERVVLLEDFSDETLPIWDEADETAVVEVYPNRPVVGAKFLVVAGADSDRWKLAVERAQVAAGLPSPHPGGAWRDKSEYVRQSYFFLTSFSANEFDEALKFAKRGGFKQVLLEQHSWCASTGHYPINETNFPGGLPTLRKTIEKFNAAGIRFGLHFLAASIDNNDPYITPVPDERFNYDVETTLAADLPADAEATDVPTTTDATAFPIAEDPYMGSGQVVRIDDELIEYGAVGPNGFAECSRGLYGTVIAEHKAGARVRHFVRAYGYHPYNLDSDLTEEVAANFAKVANALPLDMIYFDGSELLQRPGDGGEHWYYNARLHRAFYDAIDNKNILYQGSSWSPYSWNQLPRSASADGHDDLKAYLEERGGGFPYMKDAGMSLDVGWYYGYDRRATPDMYEYCLGATLGYDASFSFQSAVGTMKAHPFVGEILDLIRTYDELRLSGRLTPELKKLFQIDPVLNGVKTEEERNALLDRRRDLHLETAPDGSRSFRRIIYPLWNDIAPDAESRVWTLNVPVPARIGLQVHFKEAESVAEGAKLVAPSVKIVKTDSNVAPFEATLKIAQTAERGQYLFALPGAKEAKYGVYQIDPKLSTETTPEIRLEPGVYRIEFAADEGAELPIRVRTPLYTDEVYPIPN